MKKMIAAVCLTFLLSGGWYLDASQRQAPRRFALLIDEQHAADVDALQRLLVSDFGYTADAITTITGGNATGAAIREGIFKLASRAGASDSAFLLLALRTRFGPDGLEMLPTDADAEQPWTAIRSDEVIKLLGGYARNGFMIFPFCVARGSSSGQNANHPVYWPFENLSAVGVCPRHVRAPADISLTHILVDGLRSTDSDEISGDQLADLIMRRTDNLSAQPLSARPYTTTTVFVRQQNRIAVLGNQLQQAGTATEKVAIIRQLSQEVAGVSADRRAAWTASAGNILVAQLDGPSPDPDVQLEAARAIARIQYGPGIDAIRKTIDGSPESLRGELASVIGQFPSEQALPVIGTLLMNSSPTVRAGSLRALADIQSENSIPLVQKLLQTERVPEVIVIALQLLGRWNATDPGSLQAVSARLSDPEAAVRSEAMATLAMLRPDAAKEPILAQLTSNADPLVRERAVYTAGRYYRSDSRMESVLLQILKSDSQNSLRRAAAWALGQMRNRAAEVELRRWLLRDNPDILMRVTAAEALGFIGSPKSVLPLIDILNGQFHANVDLQVAAASALGQIGDARALEPLLNTLKSSDYSLRSAALLSLNQIQTSAEQSLHKQIHDPSREVRAAAVAKIRPDNRKSTLQLIEALDDSSGRVQDAAVKALSQNPCSDCRELMAQQLNSLTSVSAKVGLLRAIQSIRDQKLSVAALSLATDPDSGVRAEVVRLAGQLHSDQTLPIVMNAANDTDLYVRATAASSLGSFQTPQADSTLKNLTRDPSAIVRDAAVESLVSPK